MMVLSSAKQSHFPVSLLDSCKNRHCGITGPGSAVGKRTSLILGSSSILKRSTWAAKLYKSGEGLSPCGWPFCRLTQ